MQVLSVSPVDDPLAALTGRERVVLQCAVDGLCGREIAQRLHLSLGAPTRVEAAAAAVRHGLISADTGEWPAS